MYSDPDGYMPRWLENTLKIGGAVLITAALVVGSIALGGPASIILAGAALGAFSGIVNPISMATMGSMNLWMSDSFNPALAGKTFGSRFVEFMSFDGANTVSSTFLGIMHGLFDVAASLTKYLIEQEISKTTTASAFNY